MESEKLLENETGASELEQLIRSAVNRHGSGRDAVIPILAEINTAFGYIPRAAFGAIRRSLNAPDEGLFLADSHLFSTAGFYQMFSLQPTGKHIVRYCASAPCHVVGGRQMVAALIANLGILPGETDPDKTWTLLETSCLGICAVGPVFSIDDDLYGNVTPERIPAILARYS